MNVAAVGEERTIRLLLLEVIELLHLDEDDDLTEIMRDNEVPMPRKAFLATPQQMIADAIANNRP